MARKWTLLVALAVLVAAAATVIRFQPRDQATIFRSGTSLAMLAGPVYTRPFGRVNACRVSTDGGAAVIDVPVRFRSATGDDLALNLRAVYAPPSTLPGDWPPGDWCSSLQAEINQAAKRWGASVPADALIAGRREAAHSAGDEIRRHLQSRGIRVTSLRAVIDLPAGFERLRAEPAVVSAARRTRPVIFIGLDGADWELLDDYMASGVMPALRSLVREGSGGVLTTEHPPLSPLLWTTMFTGVDPLKHQILDFTRFNPYTRVREPITSDERRAPAIWNMMTAAGKTTAVFGVWATYAAEPVHGVNVSDRFFTFLFSETAVPPSAVYPEPRSSWAREHLLRAEASVTAARLRQYIPTLTDDEYAQAARADNPYAQPPSALRRILVETEVYRRLALDYLAEGPLPDLSIVYLQGTDTIGHVFAPFAPPRQPEIRPEEYERFSGVPQRYFREVDEIIATFVSIARQNDAVIVLASDHGFRWKEGRPLELSSFAAASAAKWHRSEGIFVLWGNGIAANPGHSARGTIRQICATIGTLAGIPSAAGTEVTPLPGVTRSAASVDYGAFFQTAPPPPPPTTSNIPSEEIAKLRALGYIGSTEPAKAQGSVADTRTAGTFNNAGLIHREQKNTGAAISSFERALAVDPEYASAEWNLSETLLDAERQLDRSDALLVSAMAHGLPDGARQVVGRSIRYRRSARADRARSILDAAIAVRPDEAELLLFRGRYRLDANDCRAALDDFLAASRVRPDAMAFASTGLAQMCVGDSAAARTSFERSLRLDPNQPLLRQYISAGPGR